jgi:hypothetical protein
VVVLLWIDRKLRLGPGRLFAVYIMGYGIGRYWVEGLRIDDVELSDVAGLRWNQWVALGAIVGGAAYLVATRGRRWEDAGDDAVEDDGEPGDAGDVEVSDDAAGEVGDGEVGDGDVRTAGPTD